MRFGLRGIEPRERKGSLRMYPCMRSRTVSQMYMPLNRQRIGLSYSQLTNLH